MLPWKMLLGPGLLLGMKFAKVQYDEPSNLLLIRVVYGLSQGLLFALCAYIYYAIARRGDEKQSVKVITPPALTAPEAGPGESTMTHKAYDMAELIKLTKNFALGAVFTVGIHYYMAVVPALILQIVAQPVTLFEHPLFSIYVLNKDPSKDESLKRPFADNSPVARLEAMKQASLKQSDVPAVVESEGEVETMALEDSTVNSSGGDSQISLSSAERRPVRLSSASPSDE